MDQVTMDSILSQIPDESDTSSADTFGCCSRYRQCSDAGKCLIPEKSYSVNCLYRKSLENGKIFYGKKSINYDPIVYDRFVEAYQELSISEKDVLHSVLHFFFVEKAYTSCELFRDKPEFFILENAGFFKLQIRAHAIVEKCTFDALKESCGNNLTAAAEWSRTLCRTPEEIEKWNRRRSPKIHKEELAKWILLNCPSAVSSLCEGFHYIVLSSDTRQELMEFFRDYLYCENYKSNFEQINDRRFVAPKKDRSERKRK